MFSKSEWNGNKGQNKETIDELLVRLRFGLRWVQQRVAEITQNSDVIEPAHEWNDIWNEIQRTERIQETTDDKEPLWHDRISQG